MPWPESEAEVAEKIIDWLRSMEWEVYQEVQPPCRGRTADIVGVFDKRIVWIIETKRLLNLEVMEQAHYWKSYAHFVSIGVPTVKGNFYREKRTGKRNVNDFVEMFLEKCGIGCVLVPESNEAEIIEKVFANFNRNALSDIVLKCLCDEHKTFAKAGTSGKRWTPFKATCRDLRNYVLNHQGCTLKQAFDEVKTHYRKTSIGLICMRDLIQKGVVEGVRLDTTEKPYKLYADDQRGPTESGRMGV